MCDRKFESDLGWITAIKLSYPKFYQRKDSQAKSVSNINSNRKTFQLQIRGCMVFGIAIRSLRIIAPVIKMALGNQVRWIETRGKEEPTKQSKKGSKSREYGKTPGILSRKTNWPTTEIQRNKFAKKRLFCLQELSATNMARHQRSCPWNTTKGMLYRSGFHVHTYPTEKSSTKRLSCVLLQSRFIIKQISDSFELILN